MASARGMKPRWIERTSGCRTRATTPATMNSRRTGPAARAAAQRASRNSGKVTNWIKRGTTTVGRAGESSLRSVWGSSSGIGLYTTTKVLGGRAEPFSPPPEDGSGAALPLGHLGGLVLEPLLALAQLFLGLALALLLASLAAQRRVAGDVACRLLRAARDLVDDAHFDTSRFRV